MNLPNKITMFRIFLIPVFLFVYMTSPFGEPASRLTALAIFAIASASDQLDGYLARKLNLVSNFGKLMDPLADKLLVSSALIAMVSNGVLSAWIVVVIISRDFLITGFRQLALEQNKVLAASFGGKLKTATQMVMIIVLLAFFPTHPEAGLFSAAGLLHTSGTEKAVYWVCAALAGASVVFSIVSAVEYIVKNRFVFSKL